MPRIKNQSSILKSVISSAVLILLASCNQHPPDGIAEAIDLPSITPDYTGIKIPKNIAPLSFIVDENGERFYAEIKGDDGIIVKISSRNPLISIPESKWKNLLENNKSGLISFSVYTLDENKNWKRFRTFTDTLAEEPIDKYLTYRLLFPGYEQWNELSINQRDLESFTEKAVIENTVAEDNCVNCHSYNNGHSDDFLFHMRGSLGGTYFYNDGKLEKANLKTTEMLNGAVYPRWHPSGRYVAFSSNKIVQLFHAADNKKIEVMDLESSLVIYDRDKNEMFPVDFPDKEKFMDTYPEWSPDGRSLYFSRAAQIGRDYDYKDIKYDLYRADFNPEDRSVSDPVLVFDASGKGKSISFPRISPDGKYLVMTLQDYGCFPIWHKETDLWSVDLGNSMVSRLSLNSDSTDSYHSWSSNGRWLVFSSKRGDGLRARPYIAYFSKSGRSSKPFILPQADPSFYDSFLKTFNLPEFSTTKIKLRPGTIRKISGSAPSQPKWAGNKVQEK